MAINTDNLGSPRGTTAGGRVNAARSAQIASVAEHPIGQPMANIMLDRNRESAAHSLGQQNQPYVPANPNEAKAYSVGASKAQGIVAQTGFHEAPTGIRPAVQPAAPTGGITAGVAQVNPQVTASSAQTQMRPTGVPAVRPAVNPAQSGQYLPATQQPAPAAIPARVPETFTGVQAAQTTQPAGGPTARPPVSRPALPAPSPVATAAPVSGITGGAAPAYEPTRYVNGQGQPVPRPGRITSPEGQTWNAQRNAEVVGGGGAPPTPPAGGGGGGQPPSMGRRALNMVKNMPATGGKVGLLKTGGGVLMAAPALATAITAGLDNTNIDRTDAYATRFGVAPPTGDGSVGDVVKYTALQAGGFASDVGSTLTSGAADNSYRDKNPSGNGTGEAAGQIVGGTVGAKVGSSMGGKVGTYAGKALDFVGKVATKGKYNGHLAEKVLGGTGSLFGAGAGITGGMALGDTVGSKVDQHYGNEMRPDQPSSTATQSDATDSGQSQGSGYITDSQGNRQDYNPKTQQFDGADIGAKGRGTMNIMEGAGQQHQERLNKLDAAFAKYQAAGDLEGMRRVADPSNKDHQTAIGAGIKSAKENGPNVTFIGGREPTGSGNGAYDQAMKDAMALSNPNKRVAALTALARTSMDAKQQERDYGLDMQRYTSDTRRDNRIMNESELRQQDLGLDVASKKRVAGLFDNLQNAKTPDERKAAESALLAAQGKSPSEKYMQVDVPTGDVDQYGQPVLQRMVVNPETKEVFDPRGQNASNTTTAPQPPQAGLKYAGKDAKTGQLVWTDAQGNRVIDDGK